MIYMKYWVSLMISLVCCHTISAQRMRDVFAQMPDSILEIMTKNNRLDCIDFIENQMEAKVRNRFDGHTVLKAMTEDYLDLQLTKSCRVEMKLLPVADSVNWICVVRTYSGPAEESVVAMYTPEWRKLPEREWLPQRPDVADFWMENDSVSTEDIVRLQHLQDMHFVKASLSPDNHKLAFVLQPGEVGSQEAERMRTVLCPVALNWDGKGFRPER